MGKNKSRQTKRPASQQAPHVMPQRDGSMTPIEQQFLTNYIRVGNATEAARLIPGLKRKTSQSYSDLGFSLLRRPSVQAELKRVMEELKQDTVATAEEVMSYFTAVMRGEVKDQFGLEASLSERTRAAQEIAKRTVDIENRAKGAADSVVEIKLDWDRPSIEDEDTED